MKRKRRRKIPWERPFVRVGVFAAVTALALLALLVRLTIVQLVHGSEYRAAAQANQVRLIPVPAPRGVIYDRDGHVLTRNRPSFVLALIPSEVTNITSEMHTLAGLTGLPESQLWTRLLHHRDLNYRTFDEVVTYEPYGPVVLAKDLPVPQVARLSEVLTDLPGVDVEAEAVRAYPALTFGSHLLGYVGSINAEEYKTLRNQGYTPNDLIGKDGLEAQYDTYLRGQPGGQRIVVDAAGAVVPDAKLAYKPPVSGDALVLNINWRLQTIAEQALQQQLASWGASVGRRLTGAVVVIDPWNGSVLALASYPNFDPNKFSNGIDQRTFSYYINDTTQPLFDRAVGAATPTGSTFKLVTGTAALSEGVVKRDEVVYDSGAWNCYGALFRDIAAGGLGPVTFVTALAASSDGYFFQMAWRLKNERLRKWALLFGLSKKSGIDLPGEYEGNWPTDAWMRKVAGLPLEPADVCSLGIGQGAMQATPLQMADVVSVVVNGGTLYQPQIVHEIRDAQGRVIKIFSPRIIRQVPGRSDAFAAVRDGMSRVTAPGGTAYGLGIDGLPFGGKTGTVETDGGRGPNTTWFLAYAPATHPQLAMAVFVERSGGYGAEVAAPVARQIILKYFRKG